MNLNKGGKRLRLRYRRTYQKSWCSKPRMLALSQRPSAGLRLRTLRLQQRLSVMLLLIRDALMRLSRRE